MKFKHKNFNLDNDIVDNVVEKIELEVFADNKKAIDFYNNCGFESINTKKINHQNIICMKKMKIVE